MARNSTVSPYVGRLGRSQLFSKKGGYKHTGRKPAAPVQEEPVTTKEKVVGGAKNAGKRVLPVNKAPRFYPADDVRAKKVSRKTPKPTKLRESITPGTVLILLAGRFRGKRVVFLKQLESGLLLVTQWSTAPARISCKRQAPAEYVRPDQLHSTWHPRRPSSRLSSFEIFT